MIDVLLQARELSKHFGGLKAVDQVDMEIHTGEILGLLGPNGAGKTVFFNLISGVYRPTSGTVHFKGNRIDGLPHT
jgi:branched-chain amino acid transport system ATP-binding protein